MTKAISGNSAA